MATSDQTNKPDALVPISKTIEMSVTTRELDKVWLPRDQLIRMDERQKLDSDRILAMSVEINRLRARFMVVMTLLTVLLSLVAGLLIKLFF